MTPRSIEPKNELDLGYFSNVLFNQVNQEPNRDLQQDSAPYQIEHPAVIKMGILFDSQSESLDLNPIDKYFFELSTATNLKSGKPYQINRFLTGLEQIELQMPWSGIKISKHFIALPAHLTKEHYLTQTWLNYALSPELWGPAGKWTRFHQKLTDLFEKFNLLEAPSEIGFYRLKSKAKLIEKYGFKGDDLGDCYQIILPWDFSLSSLNKLEEIITQEF